MSGLGGLNKAPDGVVIGLVQLQLPTITTKSDLAAQTKRICAMVQKARKNMSTMDLVVFPDAIFATGLPEALHLRAIEPRHQFGVGVHR